MIIPVGKFIRYLATSGELTRNRGWAVSFTLGCALLIFISVGMVKLPEYFRIEGIVEPVNLAIVHAQSDGFITDFLESGQKVSENSETLIKAKNPEMEAKREIFLADLRGLEIQRRIEETRDKASAQILDEQIEALNKKIARIDFELSALNIKASLSGTWISPDVENAKGIYLNRGQQLGLIADLNDVHIRATAGQELAAMLVEYDSNNVEIRVKGRPDVELDGEIERIFPAGQEELPSRALGYAVGGSMQTLIQDPYGIKTAENFFEVRIKPNPVDSAGLFSGQRVVVRIEMPSKPLAFQWWRVLRQLFQRRFHI